MVEVGYSGLPRTTTELGPEGMDGVEIAMNIQKGLALLRPRHRLGDLTTSLNLIFYPLFSFFLKRSGKNCQNRFSFLIHGKTNFGFDLERLNAFV